ncbi:hypothetical protein SKAU_G00082470 [Synaphobranchus kaupii]|uniref:Uncharacterized protein n=1 Tax=Synaphobranchus kaupii TaxID=118154 RepID=A0A9Q1FVK9_SYNKA|nr:hypothetical protein SKAU_G00082470 [Synaphobranchus kaupii]
MFWGSQPRGHRWSASPIQHGRTRPFPSAVLRTSRGAHEPRTSLAGGVCPRSERAEFDTDPNSAQVVEIAVAGGDNPSPLRTAVRAPVTYGPAVSGERGNIPPLPRANSSLGLARERHNLDALGLPPRVVATIQSARASSTRLHNYWLLEYEYKKTEDVAITKLKSLCCNAILKNNSKRKTNKKKILGKEQKTCIDTARP